MTTWALRIAEDLRLPLDTVTSTLVVYGGKGMGKTNFGSVLVEEMTKAGLRWSVLDPLGVWWGLRHAADGKAPGIECLILGGTHGDLPIEPTAGAVVADLVAEEEGVNVVVDFSRKPSGEMWSIGEKVRFVTDYGLRLFKRQGDLVRGQRRPPIMQILDESARYIPQVIPHGNENLAKCVGAWEQFTEEGRNVGLGVCFLTQRSARMNKSVSELADAMISFRIVGPRSIDAVTDWLGTHVERERQKAIVEQLRRLPIGQALVVSPGWLDVERVVHVRMRETFDSSATPKPGERRREPGHAAKPDLEQYRVRMAETVEKAKADDPRELRRRIQELERAARVPARVTIEAPPTVRTVEKVVEVPALKEAQVKRLESACTKLVQVGASLVEVGKEITAALARIPAGNGHRSPPATSAPTRRVPLTASPARVAAARPVTVPRDAATGSLSTMERAMLTALTQHPDGLSKGKVLVHTGYRSSGPVSTSFARLVREGWAASDGTRLRITDLGLLALGTFDPLPVGDDLREFLLTGSKLSTMEKALLQRITEAYPDSIAKGKVLEQAGYASSGPVSTAFAKLVSYGYAVPAGSSQLRAAEELFG